MREEPTRELKPSRIVMSLLVDDQGATLVEYCLLVSFIVAVSIAALTLFGIRVSNLFAPIASAL